jgi:mycothiol synthase
MRAAAGTSVRRVGYRHGTDEELAAMHTVEAEIEAERRPGAAPQPLASYVAFARSLPTQFTDHSWVADGPDDSPTGCAACWSDAAGDPDVMESYVYVRSSWRRQGVGRSLARAVVDEARAEGASRLVWATYDAVPAGEAFSRSLGGTAARVNRNSDLVLGDVDWEMVRSWIRDCEGRGAGYTIEWWDGPFPPELLDDAAQFHHIMQTAPRDDLDVGDIVLEPGHVADIDRHLVESGRERWTIFVRDPAGACVGGTEVTLAAWDPTVAMQQNTGIDPAHRGQGLAKWVKAAMLERIRAERPAVNVVRTGNAFSNAPMLAINDTLGFKVTEVRTEWQADIETLRRALA